MQAHTESDSLVDLSSIDSGPHFPSEGGIISELASQKCTVARLRKENVVLFKDKKRELDLERKLVEASNEVADLKNQRLALRSRCEVLQGEVAHQKQDIKKLLEKDAVNDELIEELAKRVMTT